ncbi:Uncharacterised protein [Acetobacterium wieringae]|uniref:hypothetical protein n=1 Tax=Acetobacterium wieringae TaxID=52694 RepID=UPI001D77D45C|nr:hypothetical protein [Acetobacterium wieringae]VUZ28524.1 Uncharacterised protein [Acetobacterium wieringae]
MAKFRKKPVVIEAVRWEGQYFFTNNNENDSLLIEGFNTSKISLDATDLKVKTLEGTMTANLGDYIIKGVQGEFYPCKPDIFEATYEPA